MKKLKEILTGIKVIGSSEMNNPLLNKICYDSRQVMKNDLFIAVRGTVTDGHMFIDSAIEFGATSVICEEIPANASDSINWIQVEDSSEALAIAASNYYDCPSSNITLIGITGTNGKTTIASSLHQLFSDLGYRCGLLSTVANYIVDKEITATHTTPDPIVINLLLSQMIEAGCDYAFMEVSSHALSQNRVAALNFAGAIFTNLTHEHLDYHGNFDNYLNTKKSFFDSLPSQAFALINADDRHAKVMVQNCKASVYTYSIRSLADYHCKILEHRFDGMNLKIGQLDIWTRFIGEFNAHNLLAVIGAADILGEEQIDILTSVSKLKPVRGRLEVIRSTAGITAIIDYAHTPDALENVISTINTIRSAAMSLITVIGAGGNRDRTKRPLMAKISVEGSDKVILTSDNPRTEDPESIIEEMIKGVPAESMSKVLRISNRREAIRTASMLATNKDIILVAGKGHETYQEINGERHHFDDREELKKTLLSAN